MSSRSRCSPLIPARIEAKSSTLPAYSPELDSVERVWLYPRERFLSLRFLPGTEAIIQACCAWNALTAEPNRIRPPCAYPWIAKVAS